MSKWNWFWSDICSDITILQLGSLVVTRSSINCSAEDVKIYALNILVKHLKVWIYILATFWRQDWCFKILEKSFLFERVVQPKSILFRLNVGCPNVLFQALSYCNSILLVSVMNTLKVKFKVNTEHEVISISGWMVARSVPVNGIWVKVYWWIFLSHVMVFKKTVELRWRY